MKNKRFAGLAVLFFPNEDEIEWINEISVDFDFFYVFDNSEGMSSGYRDRFSGNIEYISDGENHGLAYAYNMVMVKAYNNNIDFLCILDQDSIFFKESIVKIKTYICENSDKNAAIYAPYVYYNKDDIKIDTETKLVEWTINSGSFLNVKLVVNLNLTYDENYFLDRLDRDFCMQIRRKGLCIYKIAESYLLQKLGVRKNGKNVHSPIRNYYMMRNRLYYNFKYYSFFNRWFRNLVQCFFHFCNILISRDNIQSNFRMMLRGIKDYKIGQLGKYRDVN